MAVPQELDEIQWRAPHLAATMGGVHENSVLHYFAESPFFDRTSNNATITTQAMVNPQAMGPIIETRESFEAYLKKLRGIEYVVAYGPKDYGPEAPIGEGLFVIRKQERGMTRDGRDFVKVLSTYYVAGDAVMMAPSLADIFSGRVSSITLAMRNFLETASPLPAYSPAGGFSYLPNRSKIAESLNRAANSRATTPLRDTESVADTLPTSVATSDTQALVESFSNFLKYGNEYIDENPLVGEPRSFVFASSKQHVNSQKEAALKEEQARKEKEAEAKKASTSQSSVAENSQLASAASISRKSTKTPLSAGGMKKTKRKSGRGPLSPSNPQSPLNVETPG